MPLYPLTNFGIQRYYQNEPQFNGVYSLYNLPKIKDDAHVIHLDEYKSIGTQWVVIYVTNDIAIYFENLVVGHIPKGIKNFTGNKNNKANLYRIQAYDSIMCMYFCIGFIDFMGNNKRLADFVNILLQKVFEINDEIILKYCQ